MKTLDEVILCLDGCGHIDCDDCPYHYEDEKIEVDDCAQAYKDALYYLKEYREHLEDDAKNATTELERAENAYCNDVERAVRTERAWQAYRKERHDSR